MAIFGRVLRSAYSRLANEWYHFMAWFPLPSLSKWDGLSRLIAHTVQASLEKKGPGEKTSAGSPQRPLEHAGERWMRSQSQWLKDSAAPTSATADLLIVTFKTLNMSTHVKIEGSSITATTTTCPFIENARSGEALARNICEEICSHRHSLFTGLTEGLPIPIHYTALKKMGWGDDCCVKVFRILSTEGHEISPRQPSRKRLPRVPAAIGTQGEVADQNDS